MSKFFLPLFFFYVSCSSDTNPPITVAPPLNDCQKDFVFVAEDFQEFYEQFISDSIFQMSHISFPIRGNYRDYQTEKGWEREGWPLIKWDLRTELEVSLDSFAIHQSDTSFFYGSYCLDCGFSFEMAFEKVHSDWKMCYRQENNY